MRIGAHVSTRDGYRGAARVAVATGGNAFQYFPKNPRSLNVKAFDRRDAEACADWCRTNGVTSVAHGPYPVNPAAEGEAARKMALSTLNDLDIAEACGSVGVVVHFGVYKGKDPLQGYRNIIQWLNAVTSAWTGKAKVLLENLAGDHGDIGTTPEELVQIRNLCDSPGKIGFCLDTCHLFASGGWKPGGWTAFAERAGSLGYWDALEAVHLNDSRYPSGSRKDRHAAIGEGWIGEEGFRELLSAPGIRRVPLILETPAEEDGTHRQQMALVKRWGEESDP
ncbi:deoxyribonuclease IV [Cohnella sp. CFH 77786]|uniref:deoxyribonuclease IV n=1 Tax=Cohnella sp. CFH 77786 TaxID=2662265 RepID=UPI001C6101CA|nr:deoxyribonuclease IV [Cohnella sp. CFH 77786]MBW5448174.1 deoxyribonuclease IV [Cohnella sp. CFH 77786]